MRGDPYWTDARYPGKCHKCDKDIRRWARVFIYPKRKGSHSSQVLCEDPCGNDASSEFSACVFDEMAYKGGYC